MNWQCKAVAMKLFSTIPGGSHLHYWTQRNITKSLPVGAEKFNCYFNIAESHINALASLGKKPICEAQFYEFGAGWDLCIPLSFYVLGVKRQILVDRVRLARVELINETLRKLRLLGENSAIRRTEIKLLPEGRDKDWVKVLEEWYGIRYLAPCDARSTGLSSQSVDYVTSTYTLEHIPQIDARFILLECRRILRPDGMMSHVIDYRDHYAFADSRISVYNFLKYSPGRWTMWNSSFHFQNRLRHGDYLRIAEAEGFELVRNQVKGALPDSLADVLRDRLAPEFRNYRADDIGACEGHIVLRPACVVSSGEQVGAGAC